MKCQKKHIATALTLSLLLAACSTGKTAEPVFSTPVPPSESPTTAEPSMPESEAPTAESKATADNEYLYGSYFREGNFAYRMVLSPGGPSQSDVLTVSFTKRSVENNDIEWSNYNISMHEFQLPYDKETSAYDLKDMGNNSNGSSYVITLKPDGIITLSGDTECAGDYYSFEQYLILPDAFSRPLNKADLLNLNEMDLKRLRNEFYAVYGRKFTSQDLSDYFNAQPWYEGSVDSEQFDEAILGNMFTRNVLLLKEAQDSYEEAQAQATREAYTALPDAPYQKLLPKYGEAWITLSAAASKTKDMGLYYAAQGSLSVPLTITVEQQQALLNGSQLELIMNQLTGETAIITKSDNPDYGDFLIQSSTRDSYVMSTYHPQLKAYCLWQNSADTIFKLVYQGEIYVLKGACEEYMGYFDLKDNQLSEASNRFRVMDFDEEEEAIYSGNIPASNDKGYLLGLYYMGD